MSYYSPEERLIVPRAKYSGSLDAGEPSYLVVATTSASPHEGLDRLSGHTVPFIEEVERLRTACAIDPILDGDDLASLILTGKSQDGEVPTSGHFYAARVQRQYLEFDDEGALVSDPGRPYRYQAYVRLGDTKHPENPERFNVAEIAVDRGMARLRYRDTDARGIGGMSVYTTLIGSVLRPALQDMVDVSEVRLYTDTPSGPGQAAMDLFGFEPLDDYGYRGDRAKILDSLGFLGTNHLCQP